LVEETRGNNLDFLSIDRNVHQPERKRCQHKLNKIAWEAIVQ
jgi:hypothetical protein